MKSNYSVCPECGQILEDCVCNLTPDGNRVETKNKQTKPRKP